MCDLDTKNVLVKFNYRPPAELQALGSRRRRLWELSKNTHCPVIGVCLPLDVLRRLVNKCVGGQASADDYELHVGAVNECAARGRISELLQRELDRRYVASITRFRVAKHGAAVAVLWNEALLAGDVAGALWASLTHPRCDVALQERICRDMHMLQHQAGAAARVDLVRLQRLQDENLVLGRELASVQERITRMMAERNQEIEQLAAQLMQLRAESIAKDTKAAALQAELQQLQQAIPGLQKRTALTARLEQMVERNRELERLNTALGQQLERFRLSACTREPGADVPQTTEAPRQVPLKQCQVLCVGGRNGNICSYRELIERCGGHFAHHDGGQEENLAALDASLAAADLVICQTGCISHNAYWRVKDYCKRTGKRCVFVDNPSISSLARRLGVASCPPADAEQAAHPQAEIAAD